MQTFDTAAAITTAPNTATNPQLKNLLSDRVEDWIKLGLLDLTHLVLVEVGDTDEAITNEVGFSPLTNPIDGKRHGAEEFVFPFDWIEDHGGYFELVMTVGNDGFAFVLFVRDHEGVEPQLLAMCHAHARC